MLQFIFQFITELLSTVEAIYTFMSNVFIVLSKPFECIAKFLFELEFKIMSYPFKFMAILFTFISNVFESISIMFNSMIIILKSIDNYIYNKINKILGRKDKLELLPSDVKLRMLEYLDFESFKKLRSLSKSSKYFVDKNASIWKRKYLNTQYLQVLFLVKRHKNKIIGAHVLTLNNNAKFRNNEDKWLSNF